MPVDDRAADRFCCAAASKSKVVLLLCPRCCPPAVLSRPRERDRDAPHPAAPHIGIRQHRTCIHCCPRLGVLPPQELPALGPHLMPGLPGLPACLPALPLLHLSSHLCSTPGDIRFPPETFDPTDYAAEKETRRLASRLSLSQPGHPLSLRSAKRGCIARSSLSTSSSSLRQRKKKKERKQRKEKEETRASPARQASLGILGPRSTVAPRRLIPHTSHTFQGGFLGTLPTKEKSPRAHSSAGNQHFVSLSQQSGKAAILALGPSPWPPL